MMGEEGKGNLQKLNSLPPNLTLKEKHTDGQLEELYNIYIYSTLSHLTQ